MLKENRLKLQDLEGAMGLHHKNIKLSPTELLQMIAESTKNSRMESELNERQRAIDISSYELLRARNELCALEKRVQNLESPMSTHHFRAASANDAGFWPTTTGEEVFFPSVKGSYTQPPAL